MKPLTTEQSKYNWCIYVNTSSHISLDKIFYDRDELLKVKKTSSLQSLLIPLLNENAKHLDVVSSNF